MTIFSISWTLPPPGNTDCSATDGPIRDRNSEFLSQRQLGGRIGQQFLFKGRWSVPHKPIRRKAHRDATESTRHSPIFILRVTLSFTSFSLGTLRLVQINQWEYWGVPCTSIMFIEMCKTMLNIFPDLKLTIWRSSWLELTQETTT